MGKIIAVFLISSCMFCASISAAQYGDTNESEKKDSDTLLRRGLVAREMGPGVTVVVPQGAEAHRVNENLTVLESADEYAARRFVGVEDRLAKLEKENSGLKKELEHIKKYLVYLRRESLSR